MIFRDFSESRLYKFVNFYENWYSDPLLYEVEILVLFYFVNGKK